MLIEVLIDWLPQFGKGLTVNLSIALPALLIGLTLGVPLALALQQRRWIAKPAAVTVASLRAAPTFVLIFFLLNALPGPWTLGPWTISITPWASVVLALSCYGTAYVCDNSAEALARLESGSPGAIALWVTSLVRALFVMVLSSGFAATVGVQEAVSITMRSLEKLSTPGDKLLFGALAMGVWTALFQTVYLLIHRCRRWLAG